MFVIAGNTLLRPIANTIKRIPVDETASETAAEVLEARIEWLDRAPYPPADVAN